MIGDVVLCWRVLTGMSGSCVLMIAGVAEVVGEGGVRSCD